MSPEITRNDAAIDKRDEKVIYLRNADFVNSIKDNFLLPEKMK